MESTSQSLDDELLDSSINDIYESIEGVSNIDYQSLVLEDENMNEIGVTPTTTDQLILQANNPFVEDCLNETTEEISEQQLAKNQFDAVSVNLSTSDVSNENYICKVVPTEFDLSVDNVLQSKPVVLDDILPDILPKVIEDNTVPQAVYISTKPALIAVEIASHETKITQTLDKNSEKHEQTTPIPTLIISKICGDTPPPVVASDDNVSLKPKKVLKAQDSLEIPKEERDKYEPAKRVDSFELDDADRNIDAKFSALENIVNSVADYVKSNPEESLDITSDLGNDSDVDKNFVIVTEEEVKALKVEEQESLNKSQVQTVALDSQPQPDESLADTKSEILLLPDFNKVSDMKQRIYLSISEHYQIHDTQVTTSTPNVKRLPSSQSFEVDEQVTISTPNVKQLSSSQSFEIDENVDNAKSQNFTSILELSAQQKSNLSTTNDGQKTIELSTKATNDGPFLPAIKESITHDTTAETSVTNTTSNLFTTNKTFAIDPATNITQLNDRGPLPGALDKWIRKSLFLLILFVSLK